MTSGERGVPHDFPVGDGGGSSDAEETNAEPPSGNHYALVESNRG